jgi:hypothetical protein
LAVRERKEEIKVIAKSNPIIPPRDIYAQTRHTLSDEAILQMPNYPAVSRQVNLQREIPGRIDVDAKAIADIVIQVKDSVKNNYFIS